MAIFNDLLQFQLTFLQHINRLAGFSSHITGCLIFIEMDPDFVLGEIAF